MVLILGSGGMPQSGHPQKQQAHCQVRVRLRDETPTTKSYCGSQGKHYETGGWLVPEKL